MDEVSQIRDKTDIVSFIGELITLKKSGRNFKANCPFHTEKTPSFMVNPERQIWHCFGCGKGGDIYSFLMEYERLEFPEALRVLAKRAGITLSQRPDQAFQTSKKEKLYTINKFAREYYHFILTEHKAGEKARSYLKTRGLTQKIINTFMLGYAPSSIDSLIKYLTKKKGFSPLDLAESGLTSSYQGRARDFFQNRIIFPLIDHRDNVVGFAGRLLDKNAVTAKYINTRDTLVYHKSEHVYGLNITKAAVRSADQVIVVEGEFDVISCFQNGIANVVGIKGTALTESQVNLLARFAQKITFCLDADKAGREAIIRSIPVIEKKGITASVVVIRSGKDPDDALKSEPGLFKKAVREDIGIYDFVLNNSLESNDPDSAEGKRKITAEVLPLLSGIKNEIIKEHYLKKFAQALDTTYESVAKEVERFKTKEKPSVIKSVQEVKRPKEEIMEEYLLSLIIQSNTPKKALHKAIEVLSESMSQERACQKIFYHLLDHFKKEESFDGKKFIRILPSELLQSYDKSLLLPVPQLEDDAKLIVEVEKIAGKLKSVYIHNKLKEIASQIKKLEKEGADEEKVKNLQKKYSRLASHL